MITPPVGGTRWNGYTSRHRANALRFLLASTCGAVTVGFAAAMIGQRLGRLPGAHVIGLLTVAIVSGSYAIADLLGKPLPVPTRHWLVPRKWGRFGDKWFAGVFGLVLGTGFFTVMPFIGFYVLVLWCGLLNSPLESGAVAGVFGLTRGVPVLLTAIAVRPHVRFLPDMPLGVVAGYEIADRSVVRALRVVSLISATAAILASGLKEGG